MHTVPVICGIGGCQRCYTNVGTFLNHVYAVHGDEFTPTNCHTRSLNNFQADEGDENNDDFDIDNDCGDDNDEAIDQPCYSQSTLQNSSATFLLGLKEMYKLTQASLQGIVQGVTALNQQNLAILKAQV